MYYYTYIGAFMHIMENVHLLKVPLTQNDFVIRILKHLVFIATFL